MEKKKNGCFKAVSIIALTLGIIYSVVLAIVVIASIVDFQALVESFEIATLEETGGVPGAEVDEFFVDAKSSAIIMVVGLSISFAAMIAVYFLTYAKMKKYSYLTNEEANKYSGRIIAWIVVFCVCGDFINAVLLLCGYFNVTKPQIDEFRKPVEPEQTEEQKQIEEQKQDVSQVDLDKMMERIEKLQKIKEMGGLTDEEYESLRKDIVDGKK